jgi:hypothetical protein
MVGNDRFRGGLSVVLDEHAGDGVSPPIHDGHRWELLGVQPQAASVARVRREVRAVLTAWGAQEMEWVASQLLTEVVTNAVLHAGTPFDVVLTHTPGAPDLVRCEVRDHSPRRPKVRNYSLEAGTGRGMQMVDRLATAWGVLPDSNGGAGKTVWFEFASSSLGPDGDPDGDLDLDALLDSVDDPDSDADGNPGPPGTVRLPDTDVASGTHLLLPGDSTPTGLRRRLRTAA